MIRDRARSFEHGHGHELARLAVFCAAYQQNPERRRENVSVENLLAGYSAQAYAAMRIVVGLLFFCHGLQKAFGLFGGVNGAAAPILSLLGVAGWIEIITGALITIGFATVKAAFIASGQMAVAYFIGHFPSGFWPIQNDGEVAVLYCFVFLYMSTHGAGIWSVDGARR